MTTNPFIVFSGRFLSTQKKQRYLFIAGFFALLG